MKLGFIGTGNMASAMIGGIIENGIVNADQIVGADAFAPGREKIQKTLGISVTEKNTEVAETADIIVLSVKPQFYSSVISEIKDIIKEHQIIVTIAPGKTLAWVEEAFGKPVKIVRTMPNTPAMVLEGMTAACQNPHVTKEELEQVVTILKGFGKVEVVSEHLMDAVVAVSGSGPAYVFMMIEAMGDAAVSGGMPRHQAYQFAAQTLLGSAKLMLETGQHPGELKDMVCSPGGTTIEAVRALEAYGFKSAIFEAMKACEEKSKSL